MAKGNTDQAAEPLEADPFHPLIGQEANRCWFGYGSVLFLEFGERVLPTTCTDTVPASGVSGAIGFSGASSKAIECWQDLKMARRLWSVPSPN